MILALLQRAPTSATFRPMIGSPMIARRLVLAALLALPAAGVLAASDDDCGCGGPKSNPKNRANSLYAIAISTDDPEKRRRLAETILRIDPTHEGAQALLAESGG